MDMIVAKQNAAACSAQHGNSTGLTAAWQIVVFLICCLLLASQRPQDFIHAQFYAEDGARWFAQAYDLSWFRSLWIPDASYLLILPRLAAGVALCVPLRFAPLVLNLIGCALQVLPVCALLSQRCKRWGTLRQRCVLAALYISLANAQEIHINITNAQWHLALLMVLLAFAAAPGTAVGKGLDVLTFLVGGLSGPFSILLLPVLLAYAWLRRERWCIVLTACLAVGAAIQVYTIAFSAHYRPPQSVSVPLTSARTLADHTLLGASFSKLVRILGGGIVISSVAGAATATKIPFLACLAGCVAGVFILGYGLDSAPSAFRAMTVFTLLVLVPSLWSPYIPGQPDRWTALTKDPGMRYYFFPSLLVLWSAA